jgi:UDP-glucose 4-epimerase
MRAAAGGQGFDVYGDGRQVRDYVNVSDVVSAILLALRTPTMTGPVIIGSGSSVSVLDLVALAERATGKRLDVHYVPAKAGEMPAVVVDNSAARAWGWAPSVSLEAGIAEVAGEWSDHAGASSPRLGDRR